MTEDDMRNDVKQTMGGMTTKMIELCEGFWHLCYKRLQIQASK